MIKAAIYARYSSDKQRAESIDDQIAVCTEWASRNNYEIVSVYADAAQSGTTDNREQFQQMLQDAKRQEWQVLIVYKLDRFARNRYSSAVHKQELKKHGIRVLSATEPIPVTPEGILLESLMEGYAEYYSLQLAQNVKRGMESNAQKCLTNGVRTYGYKTAPDGTFEIDEREAKFIRKAFSMRAAGYSVGAIAAELSPSMGMSYKQAHNLFTHAFKNRKYIGEYKWGKTVVPDGVPPIVPLSQFRQVSVGKTRAKRKRANYILAGRIIDQDGNNWHGESAHGRNGVEYYYYSNGTVRVPCSTLEKAVLTAIQETLCPETKETIVTAMLELAQSKTPPATNELAQARHELENLNKAARVIGIDKTLAQEIQAARLRLEELENQKQAHEQASAFQKDAMLAWLDSFIESRSTRTLNAFVDAIKLTCVGKEIAQVEAFFTWDTSAPVDMSGCFELNEVGGLEQKNAKLLLSPQGLCLVFTL